MGSLFAKILVYLKYWGEIKIAYFVILNSDVFHFHANKVSINSLNYIKKLYKCTFFNVHYIKHICINSTKAVRYNATLLVPSMCHFVLY